jgi:2-octaprenyl-3-methyl-6-methoxy-1,4-benzoquinol hydroxylase
LPDEQAERLRSAPAAEFEAALNQATGGAAGTLSLAGERAAWPLSIGRASAVSGPGWALVGDAAHVVHPLAGQGVNLGLRDVAALRALLQRQRAAGLDPGAAAPLARWARERRSENALAAIARWPQPLFSNDNLFATLVGRCGTVGRWRRYDTPGSAPQGL